MSSGRMTVSDFKLKEVDVRLRLEKANTYYSTRSMDNPEAAVDIIKDVVKDLDREIMCVVNLDSKLKPLNFYIAAAGDINHCFVSVRNIFKSAILTGASHVILFHNHPSGDPKPSQEDINLTEQMIDAGRLIGIKVVDHIIIGSGGDATFSFREEHGHLFGKLRPDKNVIDKMLNNADSVQEYNGLAEWENKDKTDAEELAKDYSKLKERLFVRLFNISENEELINRCLHRSIDDEIALMYCINVSKDISGSDVMTDDALVQCELFDNTLYGIIEEQGITPEQLERDCLENAAKMFPCIQEEMESFYVVYTPEMVGGAAAIFYPGVMAELSDKCEGDFFAVPTSQSEFVVVPDKLNISDTILLTMLNLTTANKSSDTKESTLSDKIFHYDHSDDIFETTATWRERKGFRKTNQEICR